MLIDRFAADWLETLRLRAASVAQGTSCYLFIDGVFIPRVYRAFRSIVGAGAVNLLFESLPACSDAVRDVSPFLVKYDVDASERLQHVLTQCDGWPMVSLIETTEMLDQLTARLSAWCIVYADNQRFNLRFPDTRRLPGIFDALAPEQRGQMAGRVTRWSYVGRLGNWLDLPVPLTNAPAAEMAPVLGTMQFGRMVDDSEADEIIARLSLQGLLPERKPSQLHATALQALRLADSAALTQSQRIDWCETCLMQNEEVDDQMAALKLRGWRETITA